MLLLGQPLGPECRVRDPLALHPATVLSNLSNHLRCTVATSVVEMQADRIETDMPCTDPVVLEADSELSVLPT